MLVSERRELLVERLRRHGRLAAGDLAREFGVSEITIRRDLNALNQAGRLVRVHGGALRAVGELTGSGTKTVVGVVVPDSDYYFADIIAGIRSVAAGMNARLLLGVTSPEAAQRDAVRRLVAMGVDALLVTPPTGAAPEIANEWMLDAAVPTVVVERSFASIGTTSREFDQVRSDHAHGAALAVHHLASLGHSSIAVLLAATPTSPWIEQGIAATPQLVGVDALEVRSIPAGDEQTERGALSDALDAALGRGTTGFLVHHDFLALRFVELVLERGLRIPDDLAIVAYDDVIASMARVPLTAVTPPRREVGSAALELLVRRVREGTATPHAVQRIMLLPELRVRDSCGAVASQPETG